MSGITFDQASKILETLKRLEYWRDRLKKIDATLSVEITLNCKSGKEQYGKPLTELVKYPAETANSKIARSVIHAIRQEWASKEAECARTLIQLGAEVPGS